MIGIRSDYRLCVCVYVFVPFILATVSPIKVGRLLHLAVYFRVLHFAMQFSV